MVEKFDFQNLKSENFRNFHVFWKNRNFDEIQIFQKISIFSKKFRKFRKFSDFKFWKSNLSIKNYVFSSGFFFMTRYDCLVCILYVFSTPLSSPSCGAWAHAGVQWPNPRIFLDFGVMVVLTCIYAYPSVCGPRGGL